MMKQFYKIMLLTLTLLGTVAGYGQNDLVITAAWDGPLTGGIPKGVEIYVINDVPDLSVYGIEVSTNGGGFAATPTFVLSGSASAGDYLYFSSEATAFNTYFGFTPDGTNGELNVNGDDAIGLFHNNGASFDLVDIYGEANFDGTGRSWDYLDGWAYRNNQTGPNSTFDAAEWTFSGTNATDGCTTNAACGSVTPFGTFVYSVAPDETAPTFITDYPNVSAIVADGFNINVQLDEPGTFYYAVVADGTTAPTSEEVKTGTGFQAAGSGAVAIASETITASISGLTTGNVYDVYVVAEDDESTPNLQASVTLLADISPTADITAPSLLTAETSTGAAQSILLTFDEAITATDATGFSVTINAASSSISGLTVDGSTATLTFNDKIYVGDVVVLNYSTGNVQDGSGNALATISDLAVTNSATTYKVADLTALRALAPGSTAIVTGEVVLTYQRSSRNQKYIQDAGAGILIDDSPGTITTVYAIGDGITGLQGTLSEFSGLLQFVPTADPGTATSNGNTITPVSITATELATNSEIYESRVITLQAVRFVTAGTNFDSGADNYTITDGSNTIIFRDGLGEVADYSGFPQPYGRVDITGFGAENGGNEQLIPYTTDAIMDNYAPEFTVAAAAENVSFFSADITFTSDEPGTAYYLTVANDAAAPTNEDIMTTGIAVAMAFGANTISLTELADDTMYDVYVLATDDETEPNVQGSAVKVDVDTPELTVDADSDIKASTSPIGAASLMSVGVDSYDVFNFIIEDKGTADGLSTFVSSATIVPSANNIADWETTLSNASLSFGVAEPVSGTISTSGITFDLSGSMIEIENMNSVEVTLSIGLSETVTDGDILQFEIPAEHAFTTSSNGSTFPLSVTGAVSTQHTIEVEATEFRFAFNEEVAVNENFELTVSAADAFGNVDKAARSVSLSVASGAGSLSSGTALTDQALTNGIYTWSDVQLDATGNHTFSATDGVITSESNTISVLDVVSTLSLEENFEYGESENGDITVISSWTRHSGAQGPSYSAQPLVYSNYDASAVGGSIAFTNGGGGNNDGDVNYVLDPEFTTDGNIYTSFLVNLETARATADYFFHLGPNPVATTFRARLFARQNGANWSVSFGKSGATVTDNTLLDFNKTYLFVVKYALNTTGGSDDAISLYIYDGNVPTSENDAPIVSLINVDATSADGLTAIGSVAIRQGSNTPTGRIDRLRVSPDFTEAIGTFIEATTFITVNDAGFDSAFGAIVEGQESSSSSYQLSGEGLTEDITVSAPEGYQVSLNNVDFSSSLLVSRTGGIVPPTTIHVKFAPPLKGDFDGEIANASVGALERLIEVSGTAISSSNIYFEDFETCPAVGITTFSVASNRDWNCNASGRRNNAMSINAFGGDAASNDWLITPAVNLSSASGAVLTFQSYTAFADAVYPIIFAKVSTDYSGTGDPTAATWTDLPATFAPANSRTWTSSGDVDLTSFVGQTIYVAFQYTSTGTDGSSASEWFIDDISIEDREPTRSFDVISTGFIGTFGDVTLGSVSSSSSFSISAVGLLGNNVSVTLPSGFEASLSSDFITTIGNNTTPLSIEVTNGAVNEEVYVRFSPNVTGAASGNVDVSTEGFTTVSLPVSGTGVGFLIVDVASTNFNGDFSQEQEGTFSTASSFIVNAAGLTENVIVTPPSGYQVSLSSTFVTVSTNASPLTITATNNAVSNITVYVRFAPTAAQSYNGNITIASAGFVNVTIAVTGVGTAAPLSIADELGITVYPNPVMNTFNVKNDSGQAIRVELYSIQGGRIPMSNKGDQYDVSELTNGLYILLIKDAQNNQLGSTRIIKQ